MPAWFSDATYRRPLVLMLFITLIALEAAWLYWWRDGRYDWREAAASTAIALGNAVIRPLNLLLLAPLFALVYAHRLFDVTVETPLAAIALLVGIDFVYYWFHRCSHRLRWMWATHAVHHSATALNLSAAYRLGWTELLSGSWLFLLLPVWLGIAPSLVAAAFAANLAFQFALHSRAPGTLGPLEWLFNTPTHHRVHHASNPALHDRNFGGILILWDRLFGTFAEAPCDQPLRFGVDGRAPSHQPFVLLFREWRLLFADLRTARGWRARLQLLLS